MIRKYTLKLTPEERRQLEAIAKGCQGKQTIAGWKVTRAKALLKADRGEDGPGWTDQAIAAALDISERSLLNWKQKAVRQGPLAVLEPTACHAPRGAESRWPCRGANCQTSLFHPA